jgi:hypothetical protein
VQKWPHAQRGDYNHLEFFFFFFTKNYGQYEKFWIQLVKLQKFETLEGGLQKLKLWFEKLCQLSGGKL